MTRVDTAYWQEATRCLAAGEATLLSLWGEPGRVHMAVLDTDVVVLSLDCPDNRYPSVGAQHAPAIRLERAARDLFGLQPVGLPDTRPWLDHGANPTAYPFLPVEGEGLHQIPVGPVHAGIIEPGHFRFTADGETVVRLEQRLGYVHKGIDHLMHGATLDHAARLAGRTSGDSTVAYAFAFARAVETALGIEPPPRAVWLRGLMAELERIANHLGDFGAICNDASFSIMLAHCGMLRERVLRCAAACFGHRLMMDRIVPGGIAVDLSADGAGAIRSLIDEIRARFPVLVELYDKTTSLQDRTVGTGIVSADLVRRFGAGGYVGRASGRDFDARRTLGYPPYDQLRFEVPVLHEGDVNARALDPHQGDRAEPVAARADAERAASRRGSHRVRAREERAKASRWPRRFAATCWCGCVSTRRDASTAAICATHPGSSGRCWKRRSKATSSPTSRCATSRSTAPTPGTICDRCRCRAKRRSNPRCACTMVSCSSRRSA